MLTRRALIDFLRNYLASIVRRTLIATPSADGHIEVEGWGSEAGEEEGSYTARIYQHYGIASHVPEGAEAVVVAVNGGSANGAVVATELPGTRPALEKGEVAVYSKFGQKILLDKNGNVIITPKAGSKITVCDTHTQPAARKTDACGYLLVVVANVSGVPVVTSVNWSSVQPGPPFVTPIAGAVGSYYQKITVTEGSSVVDIGS